MSEEEKKAIETLKEVGSDEYCTFGDDISPKMAENILNYINRLEKEIEELKEKDNYWKANAIPKNTINYLYVSKDKIREVLKLCNKNSKLLYEEEGTYNYFIDEIADKIRSLLEEN